MMKKKRSHNFKYMELKSLPEYRLMQQFYFEQKQNWNLPPSNILTSR